jgi:hypothetical protein
MGLQLSGILSPKGRICKARPAITLNVIYFLLKTSFEVWISPKTQLLQTPYIETYGRVILLLLAYHDLCGKQILQALLQRMQSYRP